MQRSEARTIIALHTQGYFDYQIAEVLGHERSWITKMRNKMGLLSQAKIKHHRPRCNLAKKCEFQKRRSTKGNHRYSQPRCKWNGTCNQQSWSFEVQRKTT